MTFQLGIVGSDGVLLASDKLHTRPGPQGRTTFSADKIIEDPSGLIAYCCSGDDLTYVVAGEIHKPAIYKSGTTCVSFKEELLLKTQLALQTIPIKNDWSGGSIFTVHRNREGVELFRIMIHGKQSSPMINRVEDRDFQGDAINTAAFFLERYLPAGDRYRRLPLAHLRLLAAHVQEMASRLNEGGVSGVSMLLCRRQGFERLSDRELEKLRAKSKRLDGSIRSALGLE